MDFESLKESKTWICENHESLGLGPWALEPDKAQWIDEETGLQCLMVRNGLGSLCGYVGIPQGHSAHGKDYDNVEITIHGGLTYSQESQESGDPALGVCHVSSSDQAESLWWLGFDCAHAGDVSPRHDNEMRMLTEIFERSRGGDQYRDAEYVVQQVTSLARQLAA